jgi:nicotinamidase-related amidase
VNKVIDIRAFADPTSVPILVFIDLQQEYIADSRALALSTSSNALRQCRKALMHARAIGLPIAFVRWVGRSPFFNQSTKFASWIEGFEPTGSDMVFERSLPSCYASERFHEVVDSSGGNIVLAGFAGETACLSTAIDAFHRGHRATYLADASASHSLDGIAESQVHPIISKVVGVYGDVIQTAQWICATSSNGPGIKLVTNLPGRIA